MASRLDDPGCRSKVDGKLVNYVVFYDIDAASSKHALALDSYCESGPCGSWVLLDRGDTYS